MKSTAQNCAMAAEGLRSLVGGNGWDYCVLWKLSQDQRFLEWMGCCCCGAEVSIVNGGALFPGASASSRKSQCRDAVVQHTRTRACDALSDFPSSLPLDSSLGIYAQVLISNQPAWLTAKASNCTSSVDDAAGEKTRVLVPIPGGLVELFVAKHIAEDQNIIDIIMSQCHNNPYEEISMGVVDQQQQYSNPGIDGDDYAWKNSLHAAAVANDLHPWSIPHMPTDHGNFAWEPMADQPQLYASPLNLLDGPGAKNGAAGDHVFFDGPTSDLPNNSTVDHDQDMAAVAYQHSLMTTAGNCAGGVDLSPMLASGSGKDNRESIKQEAAARADSISEGSDEEEEPRPTGGRNGKRHHSKNLVAERKRRKKLNDRLYALRALVPKITKMDRASILGDAIEYVMELLKQVKDLQDELEDDANPEDDDDTKHIGSNCKSDAPNPKGVAVSNGMELGESPNSSRMLLLQGSAAKDPTKQPAAHEQPNNVDADRGNQMEPQVEVRQVEGNDFFLKVFCEHKAGGFVRLMEAMSSLGLEVTNANVTTLGPLVLNVFRVEKRENELLQVDQVRDSLLESARGTIAAWSEPGKLAVGGGNYLHQDAHQNRGNHHHHHHHHQHLNPHNQFHYLSHQL